MATKEFWIQIENHAWDVMPKNVNRMTGEEVADADKVPKTLKSPPTNATQVVRTVDMAEPVTDEALILRRYAPPQQADESDAWTVPDDRKVNPWDLNEPDPTDTGTMGTIPGATIACNVGDNVIVHFRNMDLRTHLVEKTITINLPWPFGAPFTFTITVPELLSVEERAHSLHPHGIVFAPEHDGAYPLSPRDEDQPVGAEAALWAHPSLDVDDFKKGDRVPPKATFIYKWNTFGWPSTAGVWLYHDHSICDHHNVLLGAIGTLVIHNEADENDVPEQDLPGGEHNGRLKRFCRFPVALPELGDLHLPVAGLRTLAPSLRDEIKSDFETDRSSCTDHEEAATPQIAVDRLHIFEGDIVELAADKNAIVAFFKRCYVDPPQKALYLQLYHEMPGVGMCINGRKYLGNTPTLIAGLDTKMRFGLVAMNDLTFHTFHLHAHRWVIPGPAGGNVGGSPPGGPGVQNSVLDQGVSQFEDTKIFGPANSFSFTINQGSFMGPPLGGGAKGEWHMHCHVLGHMMGGMMGSLLIIERGQLVTRLPRGIKCPVDVPAPNGGENGGEGATTTVVVNNFTFTLSTVTVASGANVEFDFQEAGHTVETVSTTNATSITITKDVGGNPSDFGQTLPAGTKRSVTVTKVDPALPGQINYRCGIHNGMTGTIEIP